MEVLTLGAGLPSPSSTAFNFELKLKSESELDLKLKGLNFISRGITCKFQFNIELRFLFNVIGVHAPLSTHTGL